MCDHQRIDEFDATELALGERVEGHASSFIVAIGFAKNPALVKPSNQPPIRAKVYEIHAHVIR